MSMEISYLELVAKDIRFECLEMTVKKKRGHLGGTFSCIDLLVALYYGGILNYDASQPKWTERDRFILSKGHACLALFAILRDLGFISDEKFESYGEDGGLGGQVDINIPGVDWNTGSLGHSLGVSAGIALAAKLDNKDYHAYTVLGDAECAEGPVWEAIAFASQHKLSNLIAIVDRNRLSVTDTLDDDDPLFMNFCSTLNNFGWESFHIDGHGFAEMLCALKEAKKCDCPVMIVANTIKGKGVSFMENEPKWHHAVPTGEQVEMARKELYIVNDRDTE